MSLCARPLASALLALAALALLPPDSDALEPVPSDEIALQNRSCMLWMGGAIPTGGAQDIGLFRLDAPGERASLRFTAPGSLTASSVWLHVRATSFAPDARLRLRLVGDVDGWPDDAAEAPAWSEFAPQPGWQEVALAELVALEGESVYHALIEPAPGTMPSLIEHVELATAVSRFPIDYQAEDPTTPRASSFRDEALAFLFEEASIPFLAVWRQPGYQYAPLFAIACDDGTLFGSPYDVHSEALVHGPALVAQSFELSEGIVVDHVEGFVRSRRAGDDRLQVELHDASLPTGSAPIASAILVPNPPTVLNRAHWFGASFAQEIELGPGSYRLVFRNLIGPSRPPGFLVSMEVSTLPPSAGQLDPTFGGAAARALISTNGGQTFVPAPWSADLPFVLANLDDASTSARAMVDEGSVSRAGGAAALRAFPGEQLEFSLTNRNVGPVAAPLAWDLFDVASSSSLVGGPLLESIWTLPNTDSTGDTGSKSVLLQVPSELAPGALWRVHMRVGHQDASTQELVIDDAAAFEIRIE